MANTSQVVNIKAGIVAPGDFGGTPQFTTIVFTTPFEDNNYAITITGSDGRAWVAQSVSSYGFIINSQANASLTGIVRWQAEYQGESL